jgi:hypothetical protein
VSTTACIDKLIKNVPTSTARDSRPHERT